MERSSSFPYTSLQKLLKREPSGRRRLRSPTLLYFMLFYFSGLRLDENNEFFFTVLIILPFRFLIFKICYFLLGHPFS